ncbi:restriction endonuclease subunit S [Vibrio vulnificus]|uniref:restriction endonuclease subunit S n=1 Tax=Vibrio vulnificus TaxID=672 RepID=UPI000DAE385E|nr:restriction endonuclease subunit S [Vibrio vulnificus]MDK2680289.1 restriction endonuclease subunit S [Vibrio vulnificus]RAH35736.1 restriction endonuclease subunit S [Vibrio vulnificus]
MSWPMVKLGDVSEPIMGQAPPGTECNKSGQGTIFVKAGEFGVKFPEVKEWTTKPLKFAKTGDTLLCVVGATCGKVNRAIDCSIGRSVAAIRPNTEVLDSSYLYYFISSWSEKLRLMSQGAAQTVINKDMINSLEIPLPPIDEQKRIAAILDKADAIRQKRKQAIDLADEFLRSVFLDMFGDPVTNPKGWEVKACKDLFKRITVGIVVKPSSYYVESGVPALRSLNIGYYGIRSENLVYVSKSDNESILSKTRVYEGDLVIVRSGQPGKTAVVCKEFDGVNAIDILIATPKEELIEPQFFAFFMNSDGGKKIVLAEQRGQVQKHFNVGSLNSTAIPLPPLSLQRTFAEIVATVYGKYQTNKATEFNEIFNSISQKAFSGQL